MHNYLELTDDFGNAIPTWDYSGWTEIYDKQIRFNSTDDIDMYWSLAEWFLDSYGLI